MRTDGGTVQQTALPRSRTTVVVGGILVAVLGLLAVVTPLVIGLAITLLVGVLLIVGALGHVLAAFSGRDWKGFIFQVVLAALYGVAGVSLLVDPIVGLVTLTLLLVAYLLAQGVVEVVLGLRLRPAPRWGWVVASGAFSILLAVLLYLGFPATAAWAIGLLVGLSLLSTGITMVALAFAGTGEAEEAVVHPAGGGEP